MRQVVLTGIIATAICAGAAHAQEQASPPSQSDAPVLRAPVQSTYADPRFLGTLPNIFREDEPGLTYAKEIEAAKLYQSALASADCILELGAQRPARAFAEAGSKELAVGNDIYTRYRGCKRGAGALLPLAVDGAVAERLLASTAGVTAEPRAMHVNVDEATRFHGDLSGRSVVMSNLARCAAVYSPGLAMEVLRTEVGSDQEAEALSELFARTPECGIADRPSVPAALQRGAVAAAVFSWTHKNG